MGVVTENHAGAPSASTVRPSMATEGKQTAYQRGYIDGLKGWRNMARLNWKKLDKIAYHHGHVLGVREREKQNAQAAAS